MNVYRREPRTQYIWAKCRVEGQAFALLGWVDGCRMEFAAPAAAHAAATENAITRGALQKMPFEALLNVFILMAHTYAPLNYINITPYVHECKCTQ